MKDIISKAEHEQLNTAISKILSNEVLEKDITGNLPKIADLCDSNKIYAGKVSVLFVDMRKSTKLPEQFPSEQLVKIYRSYIRTVVQAIRYSGGVVRDFMGDGVLSLFVDDEDGKSEEKAVVAARYIATAIDKCLNPALDEILNYRLSCGIGINTGEISLSKVGMKGKEKDEDSENEYGIAWIGASTNLACKQCSVMDKEKIFICNATYSALTNTNKKEFWKQVDIHCGHNTLHGYVADKYYLKLDNEAEPCVATSTAQSQNVLNLVDFKLKNLEEEAKTLGKTLSEINKKQTELDKKEKALNNKKEALDMKSTALKKSQYYFYRSVLGSAHCKAAYAKSMGKDFWEQYLQKAISIGAEINKSEQEVKQDVSCFMVSIYEDLELYDKAYDFLVEQALGYSWLNLYTVQKIVNKVCYCDRLKSALYTRLARNDLTKENREKFEAIKNWLVFDFK